MGSYADRRKPPSDSGRSWTSALGRGPSDALPDICCSREISGLAAYPVPVGQERKFGAEIAPP